MWGEKHIQRVSNEEWDKMFVTLQSYSDDDLKKVINGLSSYNSRAEYAPGISMDSYVQAVYSEWNNRGI